MPEPSIPPQILQPPAAAAASTQILSQAGSSIGDSTGITGKDAVANMARLIAQFGTPVVVQGFFLVVVATVLYFALHMMPAAHERNIKAIVDANEKHHVEAREDRKESDTLNRESNAKQWQKLSELTAVTRESNVILTKSAEIVGHNGEIMTKSLNELKKLVTAKAKELP